METTFLSRRTFHTTLIDKHVSNLESGAETTLSFPVYTLQVTISADILCRSYATSFHTTGCGLEVFSIAFSDRLLRICL